jgi:DNA-directed RNA polymerase subunit H (RpoH/RPB5)
MARENFAKKVTVCIFTKKQHPPNSVKNHKRNPPPGCTIELPVVRSNSDMADDLETVSRTYVTYTNLCKMVEFRASAGRWQDARITKHGGLSEEEVDRLMISPGNLLPHISVDVEYREGESTMSAVLVIVGTSALVAQPWRKLAGYFLSRYDDVTLIIPTDFENIVTYTATVREMEQKAAAEEGRPRKPTSVHYDKNFMLNFMNSYLMPVYTVLSKEEAAEVLKANQINMSQIPEMSSFDAAAVWLKTAPGDIVIETHPSETAGSAIGYRRIITGSPKYPI